MLLGLIFSAVAVVIMALAISHVRMRRRQLAEAQAYARIRALRGLAQRQQDLHAEPALQRRDAMRR